MLYLFRVLLSLIWFCIVCSIGIFVSILRPFETRNIKVATDLIALIHKLLGVEIILRNENILDQARPCVFISNHQDNFDIIPGCYTLPKNTVTIGKKSILFIPFFGQFFWLSGNILIDRKNKKSAVETMDVAANAIKNKKVSIWVMPEGTRSKGRGLLPFKKGPFITAIKAHVPIVPIAFSTYPKHLNLRNWKAGKIIVEVLPPISTSGLKMTDVDLIKDKAFVLMKTTIAKLDNEIENSNE